MRTILVVAKITNINAIAIFAFLIVDFLLEDLSIFLLFCQAAYELFYALWGIYKILGFTSRIYTLESISRIYL